MKHSRAIKRRQAARAKAAPYRYTPMYPKPTGRKSPASGVTVRRDGLDVRVPSKEGRRRGDSRRPSGHGVPSVSEGRARPSGRADFHAGEIEPVPARRPSEATSLPDHYGETRLVAQARDPHWIHAYWELAGTEARRAEAGRPVLRVYALTTSRFSSKTIRRWFDITPTPEARDWFVEVGHPASWWCLELGLLGPGGFAPLVRSNLVETPADRPSDEYEAGWPRLTDALAAPRTGQASSLDVARDRSAGARRFR